jgi:hypothetical protein
MNSFLSIFDFISLYCLLYFSPYYIAFHFLLLLETANSYKVERWWRNLWRVNREVLLSVTLLQYTATRFPLTWSRGYFIDSVDKLLIKKIPF